MEGEIRDVDAIMFNATSKTYTGQDAVQPVQDMLLNSHLLGRVFHRPAQQYLLVGGGRSHCW